MRAGFSAAESAQRESHIGGARSPHRSPVGCRKQNEPTAAVAKVYRLPARAKLPLTSHLLAGETPRCGSEPDKLLLLC